MASPLVLLQRTKRLFEKQAATRESPTPELRVERRQACPCQENTNNTFDIRQKVNNFDTKEKEKFSFKNDYISLFLCTRVCGAVAVTVVAIRTTFRGLLLPACVTSSWESNQGVRQCDKHLDLPTTYLPAPEGSFSHVDKRGAGGRFSIPEYFLPSGRQYQSQRTQGMSLSLSLRDSFIYAYTHMQSLPQRA